MIWFLVLTFGMDEGDEALRIWMVFLIWGRVALVAGGFAEAVKIMSERKAIEYQE